MYRLKLYVAGQTSRARKAARDLTAALEEGLPGRYTLETFDLLGNPELGRQDGVFATPMVVKVSPAPVRKVVGDFSNGSKVRNALGIGEEQASQ